MADTVRPAGLSYPCYWMYRDNENKWRWIYYAANGEEISVSSESYNQRTDCRRGVDIMRNSAQSEVYVPGDA